MSTKINDDSMSLEIDGQVIATAEFREHAGADGRGASSSELVLKPGDGLYMPMWMPHRACASDQGSIHLAVAVRPARIQDALAFAAGRARGALEVPDFLAGDRDARREALAAVLKDLVRAGRSRFSMSTRSFPRPRRAPGALRQTRGLDSPLIGSIILLQLVFSGAV